MRDATAGQTGADAPRLDQRPTAPDPVATAAERLARPGLVVVTGSPGAGRSSALRAVADRFGGTVFAGGGLAILRGVPGLALSRAVRARLPVEDGALTAEAVRSRVRGGLLVLDDLQWADPLTLATLPGLAAHCRVLVSLRTPHRLPAAALAALRAACDTWLALPPLTPQQATELARRIAPGLGAAGLAEVVARAGGVPLAVETLARHAVAHPESVSRQPEPDDAGSTGAVAHAVAEALADLTRPARTAMAALGMLRRPAARTLLGAGVAELAEAGLVVAPPDDAEGSQVAAVSPYVAEVAAGLLSPEERAGVHRRLAELVPDAEAARHLAAAGDDQPAYERAVAAAATAETAGERADLLLLACGLDGAHPRPAVRRDTAAAALAVGRPRAALRALADAADADSAVLRGEALLQLGEVDEAVAAVTVVPDAADRQAVAARDRVLLLGALARDRARAAELAEATVQRHGRPPEHTGLRAALAAVDAAARHAGWERELATAAAAAGAGGDALAARWSAWLLVETLAADGRLAEAAENARLAADACASDLAYSWQTRFLAAELWCTALRGEQLDDVVRRAVALVDRTLPAVAHGYATAAAALAEADGGLLASARARLGDRPARPVASVAGLLDWVAAEAAWLDGQPEAATPTRPAGRAPLLTGLAEITGRWVAYDAEDGHGLPALDGADLVGPAQATLAAWQAVTVDPAKVAEFDPAATAWHDVARREEVRCLLAHGLYETDASRAVPPLLRAEQVAEQAGLVVLLGRTRRALRRHAVRRETRGPRAGMDLTDREREVLRLVAQGEPTRRIAGLLGISRETVETHIRAGMRKLGAKTRTEAAGLALELLQ
ncbi:LuxR C-terminal-related transcriptional regulator [Actinocatenispora sera]|uniref:helix-turn-helix transcriptional regulator n=1 Tax=Actinocatenispora sera TaxID=390989 RepID=UPI0034056DAD